MCVLLAIKKKKKKSVPGAKSYGQPIWLKLGTEVRCDEIFQTPILLTSLTVSFGQFQGGLSFCPLSTKNPAFQGTCQMNLTVDCTILELLFHACNFALKVLEREEHGA